MNYVVCAISQVVQVAFLPSNQLPPHTYR